MPFGIGHQPEAGLLQRAPLADAGDDVLQGPPVGMVVVNAVGRHQRNAETRAERRYPPAVPPVVAAMEVPDRQPQTVGRPAMQVGKPRLEVRVAARVLRRQRDQRLAFHILQHLLEGEQARTLFGGDLSLSQQPAETSVGRPVRWIAKAREPVGRIEPRPHQEPQALLLRLAVGPHDAGERVAVGDADREMPERLRLDHQFARMRRPAQEGKIGGAVEFGIGRPRRRKPGRLSDRPPERDRRIACRGGHVKSPWTYQRGKVPSLPV